MPRFVAQSRRAKVLLGGRMRLEAVTVKNFRGYTDEQEVVIGDLTTIVGRNDVGKSTILEALAIFFGSEVVKADAGDVNVDSDAQEFEVTCTFSELPEKIVLDAQAETSLKDEFLLTQTGRLRVRKRWTCSGAKPKEEVFVVCHHPVDDDLNDLLLLGNAALKTRLSKRLEPADAAEVNKASNPAMRKALWASEAELVLEESDVPVSKEDSKRIWERLAPLLPHFALFQSDRSSRDSDSEVQDPMKLAITAALAENDVQQALAGVVSIVRERATELATRTHAALEELDPELADGLVASFKNDPRWSSLFGVTLEGRNGIPINKRGSGVRRLVLVSFFKAEAQRQIEEGSKRSVIYAIEEPETSQHPRNQKILLESFQEMAQSEGCQVLLTTHSPGLAGHLPTESLRFVARNDDGAPQVRPANEDTWDRIAQELGVLPDDRVRALVCVEGPNDVAGLKALSGALCDGGESLIDLRTDNRFAFVLLGGGTLHQWVSERYLKGFGRPEFHLYDNDVSSYQKAVDQVNGRSDGSSARLTARRELENYLHPDAITSALGVTVSYGPTDDVPALVSAAMKADPNLKPVKAQTAKRYLAERVFPKMTRRLLIEAGGADEVRDWMQTLQQMAK